MATLDKDLIKYLSKLSKIDCSDEEQEAILKDLQNILNYIDLLEEVDTDAVQPCNHVLAGMQNVMREDRVEETLSREKFLENAPAHVGGLIRVPPVITKGGSNG